MSVETESFYVPVGATYPVYDAPVSDPGYGSRTYTLIRPRIQETIVGPPKVQEVQVNELLPFRVSPTYTVNRWVVRSNVPDRGALASQMLVAWRPEDLDYGSDADTSSVPQVFLFTNDRDRVALQNQLYRDFPELNLQSYRLKVPVRINTHTFPGASYVPRHTVILPSPIQQTEIIRLPSTPPFALPPEITDPLGSTYAEPIPHLKSKRSKSTSRTGSRRGSRRSSRSARKGDQYGKSLECRRYEETPGGRWEYQWLPFETPASRFQQPPLFPPVFSVQVN